MAARGLIRPTPVACVAEFLLGSWSLERLVFHRSGARASFTGRLEIERDGGQWMTSTESGTLELFSTDGCGHRGEASRVNRYRVLGGGRAIVHFADGSRFHDLDLTTGADRLWHDCGDDDYRGVTVAGSDEWWTRWRCSGPEKSYVSTTRARRVGA